MGGFGEGAALAIQSVITFPQRLAGIVALSSWFIFAPPSWGVRISLNLKNCYFLLLKGKIVSQTNNLKLATEDLQNSCIHVSSLLHNNKVCVRELLTQVS